MIASANAIPMFQALEFGRYRCFRDVQRPTLGRLNLIYGANNAGKSAFLRVPALLSASRTPGRAGIELGGAVRNAGFREVLWRGALPSGEDSDLVLGARLSDQTEWRWTLRWTPSRGAVIQSVRVAVGGVERQEEDIQRDDLAARDRYLDSHGDIAIEFDGLIPRPGASEVIGRHRGNLVRALDSVIWLEAKRIAPTREGFSVGAEGVWTSTGEGAAAMVAADPKLRDEVSKWFRQHVGWRVDIEALGSDRQRLVLEPNHAGFGVPFPDAGEGVQQVFPLVVALEHLRQEGGLLCVEEPESHLHPKLERGLAQLTVDVLRSQPAASVLIETHSEVFLVAALTAAIAELKEAVRTFWVSAANDGAATVEEVPLDSEARPTTPLFEQAFDTMGVMRRELLEARRARKSHAR